MRNRPLPARAVLAAAVLCAAAALLVVLLAPGSAPDDFGARPTAPPAAAGPEDRPRAAEEAEAAGPDGRSGTSAPERSPAAPTAVAVPRVGLDATVEPVGVQADGTVEIPDAPQAAGWYRFGTAPGASDGSAVLVGHVDFETGELGEFAALYDVRRGDTVRVDRGGAPAARYEVTARAVVDQDELPRELFRRDGPHVLTLITCAPPYDEEDGYRNNLVVTAEPVGG
ncbi:class F sortase [Streptomyces sp. GSL17-111]|uniref:class F sortase n=1 Tax=Streptomyces sp. GSL17-111 TaxID=3121596 RepID=UPI0030F3F7A4